MAEAVQNVHEPGVEVFTVRPEQVEVRTDTIAAAWARQGYLTIIHEKPLETGAIQVTCIAFSPGSPAATREAMDELGISESDLMAALTPSEGQAQAQLEF